MVDMTPEAIAKLGYVDVEYVEALLRGVSKDELSELIAKKIDRSVDSPNVETVRMNTVASLRSVGFEVTGGRKGRGQPYRIVGFVKREPKLSVSEWTSWDRNHLDWVINHPTIGVDDNILVNKHFCRFGAPHHEASFGYLWSYELARDTGFFVEWYGHAQGIVIRKFKDQPRFRIFDDGVIPVNELLKLAIMIAPGSVRPVSIVNVSAQRLSQFREFDPRGVVYPHKQALVDIRWVNTHTDDIFSKNQRSGLRKTWRETKYYQDPSFWFEDSPTRMLRVLNEWKRLNYDKHRQPALSRDEVAIKALSIYPFAILGTREDPRVGNSTVDPCYFDLSFPTSFVICDRLSGRPEIATLLVEKSLNYSMAPDGSPVYGGKSGTTDAMMSVLFSLLEDKGIEYLNMGTYDGGGDGLPAHKLRYAKSGNDVTTYTFVTSFPYHVD